MKKLSFLFISLLTAFAFAGCTDGLDNVEYNPSNGVVLSAPVSGTATSSSLTVTSTMTGNVGVVLKKVSATVRTYRILPSRTMWWMLMTTSVRLSQD